MAKPTIDEILDRIVATPHPSSGLVLASDACYVRSISMFGFYKDGYYELIDDFAIETFLFRFAKELKNGGELKGVNVDDALAKNLRKTLRHMNTNVIRDVDSPRVALKGGTTVDFGKPDGSPLGFACETWHRGHAAFLNVPFSKEEIEAAGCPKFLKFLESMLVLEDGTTADPELADWMQLFFGNLILPSLSSQSVTFLVGERAANGKSTLMDVVQAMIGPKYVSAMSMEELSRNGFAVQSLRGKRLNIGEEEESKFVSSALFKKLVSGELVDADVKYEGRVQFRNRAKFVFLTNSNPTFKDYDRGTRRRFFLVPFNRSFENDPVRREREELVADLLTELPGIWRWAIAGAKRLIALKYVLPRTRAMQDAQDEFERAIKSSYEFMEENYEISPAFSEDSIPTFTLFDQYAKWCEAVKAQPMKRQNFVTDIRRRFEPDGLSKKARWANGTTEQSFFGLRPRKGTGSFVENRYYAVKGTDKG